MALTVLLAIPTWAHAQNGESGEKPPKAVNQAVPAAAPKAPPKKRIRSGSYLVGNRGIGAKVDSRGDFERRRDMEIMKHFTRRAQLDVLARRAKQATRNDLLERLDRIRRVEDERHRLWMQELSQAAVFSEMRGLP